MLSLIINLIYHSVSAYELGHVGEEERAVMFIALKNQPEEVVSA